MKKILLLLLLLASMSSLLFSMDAIEATTRVLDLGCAYEMFSSSRRDGNLEDFKLFYSELARTDYKGYKMTFARMDDWKIDRTVRAFIQFVNPDMSTSIAINLESVVEGLIKGDYKAIGDARYLFEGACKLPVPKVPSTDRYHDLYRLIAKKVM